MIHPTAIVSEQENKKCPPEHDFRTFKFQPPYSELTPKTTPPLEPYRLVPCVE